MWRGSAVAALLLIALPAAPAAGQCTTSAADVVDVLYLRILERQPDAQSRQLIQELSSGRVVVRDAVAALAKSQEHLTRLWLPIVDAVFRQIRNTAPDRERALDVARSLARGARTLDEVSIALAVEETAGLAPDSAVIALYRRLLGRDPTSEDVAVHAPPVSREGVEPLARAIVNSLEFRDRFGRNTVPSQGIRAYDASIATLYRKLLGRDPDAPGAAQLARTASESGFAPVIDQMVASAEYQRGFGAQGIPGAAASSARYCGVP
jgi:hypothetical protein